MFNVLISKLDIKRLREKSYTVKNESNMVAMYNQMGELMFELVYDNNLGEIVVMTNEDVKHVDEVHILVNSKVHDKVTFSVTEHYSLENGIDKKKINIIV